MQSAGGSRPAWHLAEKPCACAVRGSKGGCLQKQHPGAAPCLCVALPQGPAVCQGTGRCDAHVRPRGFERSEVPTPAWSLPSFQTLPCALMGIFWLLRQLLNQGRDGLVGEGCAVLDPLPPPRRCPRGHAVTCRGHAPRGWSPSHLSWW